MQNTTHATLATSTEGMVTSPHGLASEAGLEVLRAGGNAIEAAIAIGAALSVTYPHFTGLGGDAFDRLATQLNAMLDKVERLMIELRVVTDSLAHDLRVLLRQRV